MSDMTEITTIGDRLGMDGAAFTRKWAADRDFVSGRQFAGFLARFGFFEHATRASTGRAAAVTATAEDLSETGTKWTAVAVPDERIVVLARPRRMPRRLKSASRTYSFRISPAESRELSEVPSDVVPTDFGYILSFAKRPWERARKALSALD